MCMENKIEFDFQQIDRPVDLLIKRLGKNSVLAFYGDLGSGKTTFIKYFLKKLGIKKNITSPTFSYLNIYDSIDGKKYCHFDLYRIKTIRDFLSLGFDEYLENPMNICLIEWPNIIKSILVLQKNVLSIEMVYISKNRRLMTLKESLFKNHQNLPHQQP